MHHLPFMSSITKKDWTGMACLFSKKNMEAEKTQHFWNNLDRRTEETEVEALAVRRLMKSKPSISA